MSDSNATLVGTVRRLLRRRDTDRSVNPEASLPESQPESQPESLRGCPKCGEQVHVYAVRCRHCGQDLELRAG